MAKRPWIWFWTGTAILAVLALAFARRRLEATDRPPKPLPTVIGGIHLQSINRPDVSFPEFPRPQWTLVNLWAPWCAPCRAELPLFNELANRSDRTPGRPLQVVGIALDSTIRVERFLAHHSLSYPVFVVPHQARQFVAHFHLALVGLPVTILLNRRNQVVATHVGIVNPRILAGLLPKKTG
jgi:thiol-disulfide isomerase/thioredoxin